MGSMERSKKKVQLWKKAIVHFLLCFVMGFFTGFAPAGKASIFSGRLSVSKAQANSTGKAVEIPHGTRTQGENLNGTLLGRNFSAEPARSNNASKPAFSKKLQAKGVAEDLDPRRLIIIVTPTSGKNQLRGVLIRRLASTLRLVPQPLVWVVVEQQSEDSGVSEILRKTGIMYRHLVSKENFTDIQEELDHQRNVALNHIEHHRLSGIVHFAGLFNVYDLSFFHQLRSIEVFGTWPVALLSANKNEVVIEGPVCDSSEVIGWHLKRVNINNNQTDDDQKPAIRVSNFAFNSSILWDPERWGRTSSLQDTSQDSLKFVRKEVIEDEAKLMGIPQEDDCSKVLLWNLQFSTL
ncbi:probable beta-1,4-xylosyltransferase IRX9 [Ipomoea triloba]|uniref:probable beta-1,4-xylosyltransferase IRX9 n=1 Tax=Ipomoea triloba TaxID=35885 RepID=UPI00125D1879|nr:probable beta-1,4-xylosyltransferase IRX9 [Ipomoea triloba]